MTAHLDLKKLIALSMRLSIVFGVFVLFNTILSASPHSEVCAQGVGPNGQFSYGPLLCTPEATQECPLGSTVLRNDSQGNIFRTPVTFCGNQLSEFCRVLTGSGEIVFSDGGNDKTFFCERPPIVGRCESENQGGLKIEANSSVGAAGYLNNLTSRLNSVRSGLDVIGPRNSNNPGNTRDTFGLLAEFVSAKNFRREDPLLIFDIALENGNYELTCGGDDSAFASQIKIPSLAGLANPIDSNTGENGATINDFFEVYSIWLEAGLQIQRERPRNDRFCEGGNQFYFGQTTEQQRCYNFDAVGQQRPCVVNMTDIFSQSNRTDSNAYCISGIGRQLRPSYPFYAQFDDTRSGTVTNFSIGNSGNDDLQATVVDVNSTNFGACTLTAFDVLRSRSNTGCSSFVTVEPGTNTITTLPGWEQCIRCVYNGNTATSENDEVIAEACALNGVPGDCVNNVPRNVDIIAANRPDLEPFLQAEAGAIYTSDLGCINASNPSNIINTFLRIALVVMGGIVIFRFIQAAIVLQGRDPESIEQGREIVISAIAGLLLLIFSAALLDFLVGNVIGIDPNAASGNPNGAGGSGGSSSSP